MKIAGNISFAVLRVYLGVFMHKIRLQFESFAKFHLHLNFACFFF